MSLPCILLTFSLLSLAAGKGHEVSPAPNTTQVSNCPCQCGPQGPPGPPGRDGRDGLSGPIGAPGAPGVDGRDGDMGPPGTDGRDGEMGPPGTDGRDGDMGNPGRDGRDGSPGRDGLPGTNGANGRDGRDGAVGPPGPSSGLVANCPGWSADRPATSCRFILDCNPSTSSGYYWITNGARPHIMYCYMETDKCGVRGVMRVAHIDMRISSVDCPAPLTQYELDSGERMCGSTKIGQSCDSVIFPTHHLSYQYVCGRAAGFSYFHPCAFYYYKRGGQNTIDHAYVSGLSITYGPQNGRNHIWTYAGGYQESFAHDCNCPCAVNPGASSPSFVGQDLYCESATRYSPQTYEWFTNNTLWDGKDCYPGSSCCDNPLAPWFRRTLQEKTTEDIEVRWCTTQGLASDRVATELLELYVY